MQKSILALLLNTHLTAAAATIENDVVGQFDDWYAFAFATEEWSAAPYAIATQQAGGDSLLSLACRDFGKGYTVYVEVTMPTKVPSDTSETMAVQVASSSGFSRAYIVQAYANTLDHLRLTFLDSDTALLTRLKDDAWITLDYKGVSATYSLQGSKKAMVWMANACPIGVSGPHQPLKWIPQRFNGGA